MPKISQIFRLEKTQRELDFIDINTSKDTRVFLNPFVLASRNDPFSIDATRTITSFFQQTLNLIAHDRTEIARENFGHLNEPNETCLGFSRRKPNGKGMGDINTDELFESISNSEAVKTKLLEDLADTAIFIPNIGRDKISDMTTNIIRMNLIKYTQTQCNLLNIPLTHDVPSGFYWDIARQQWDEQYTDMLVVNNKKVLLVPKGVVSYVKEYTYGKYHRYYALTFLQEDHLSRNTSLVKQRLNKDGTIKERFVTKRSLTESELPEDKFALYEFTVRHPEIFKDFKEQTAKEIISLPDSAFESFSENELIDFLIAKLTAIDSGNNEASEYHSLMIGILEYIFYPNLLNPNKEREINEGRKRIDISFDNGAIEHNFFYILQHTHNIPCPYIFFECKNYSKDIANPELDQMIGRFSPNRGKFGIIICRSIANEELFNRRCTDTFKDEHGLILPLTDSDIIRILEGRKRGWSTIADDVLSEKTRDIILA